MGLARRRAVNSSDDRQQFDRWRHDVYCGWHLPIHAPKENLPNSLPVALGLPDDRMAGRARRSFSHGLETRPVLHGLLLASDAAAVRGRGNESAMDRRPRHLRIIRTSCAKDLASVAAIWAGSALLWGLVGFLGETGYLDWQRFRRFVLHGAAQIRRELAFSE